MSTIDRATMHNICQYGTYYNPAHNHYGRQVDVVCDRCHKTGLGVCIGWQTYDLCLQCTQDIHDSGYLVKPPMTQYPATVKPREPSSKMLQYMLRKEADIDQVSSNDRPLTYMMQNQFGSSKKR